MCFAAQTSSRRYELLQTEGIEEKICSKEGDLEAEGI